MNFGNIVAGKITINGEEHKPLRCECGNTQNWQSFTQTGNKTRAVCTCGRTVER